MQTHDSYPTPTGSPAEHEGRPRNSRAPLTDAARQRIINAYTDGLSIRAIEQTFKHSKQTVRKTLGSAGIEIREDRSRTKLTCEQLERSRDACWTPRQIADAYDVDIRTVHRRLRKVGTPAGRPAPELPVAELAAAYKAGESVEGLAAVHHVAPTAVRRALVAAGVAIRSQSPRLVSEYKLADYCRRGLTIAEIAADQGLSRNTIAKYLAELGLRAADKRPGRVRPAISTLRADR